MAIFTNQATLQYNNTLTSSNVVTGNLVEALTLTKNALVDTYVSADKITYVVTLINTGSTALTDLTLTDDLGAYTYNTSTLIPLTYVDGTLNYYLNGVLQNDPDVTVNNGISITGITIPAGGIATFIYETTTNVFTPLASGSSVVNIVTVSGESLAENITATETIVPAVAPNLSITKAISPTTVSENGQLTYTLIIQNTGNEATASTGDLVVTDTFNPVLNDIVVTYNGVTLTEGTDYTYVNGVFTTTPGTIAVPAATYTQAENGAITITPGVSTLTITGTV